MTITNVGKDMKKLKLPCTAGRNVKQCNHFGIVSQFFRWLNMVHLQDLTIPLLDMYTRKVKTCADIKT